LDGAIAAYNEAVRRAPDEGYFHYELAKSSEKKGDLDAAIVQAREATRIGPDNFIWHRDLAKMLRSKGDEDAAAKEMQIANALQPRNMPKRIRVGGRVISAKLVHQVRPKYPVEAKMDHIEGTVRLDVVLNPDGTVQSLKVLSGDPTLAQAAQKAVSQWRYQPTLLNGDAVEVATEIDVNFELAKR
jgi:TonB family protein